MKPTLFGAFALICSAPLFAQYPPAQGPLAPLATDQPTELPIRKMVDVQLREILANKLVEVNKRVDPKTAEEIDAVCRTEQPACDKARAHVSAAAFTTTLLPSMTQTQYTDKPNSKYLKVTYSVELRITNIRFRKFGSWISYPFNRTAFVNVNIGIFCDRWETGLGEITVQGRSERPYLDDPSFSEEVLSAFFLNSLIPAVDSGLRAGLMGFVFPPMPTGVACNRMDYLPGNPADLLEGWLRFKLKPAIQNPAVTSPITVKLVSIKRLPVHTPSGQIVYDAIENPALEFFANFAHVYHELPAIVEGQTLSLAAIPPMFIAKPDNSSSLILIATVSHNFGNPRDSVFVVLPPSNFGAGRRTLTVTKTYSYIPRYPPYSHSITEKEAAYEITVDITLPAGSTRN